MVKIPLVVKPLPALRGRARRARDQRMRAILMFEVDEDSFVFHQTRSERIIVPAAESVIAQRVPIGLDLAEVIVRLDRNRL